MDASRTTTKTTQIIASVVKDMEKLEPLCIVGENVRRYSQWGRQYDCSLKKLKIELLFVDIWSSSSTFGYIPKRIERRDIYTTIFKALFTVVTKQPNYPFTDKWVKMWYIHTVGFHAALKKNYIVCYNMDVLSEISHKKTSTIWFHSYEVLRVVRIIKTGNIMVVAKEWGGENEELLFNGYSYISTRERVIGGGWWCTIIWIYLVPPKCTGKTVYMVSFMSCVFYHKKKEEEVKRFTLPTWLWYEGIP